MTIPEIHIHFKSSKEAEEQIYAIVVKSVSDAVNASRGNVEALKEYYNFASHLKFITSAMIDEAVNGAPKSDNGRNVL